MLRVTLRNLVARKVRLLLSAFAIVLGVAFVAGSFIFTDALGGAFNGIIKGTTADVEVTPEGIELVESSGQDSRTIPASVVDDLTELAEVESAAGIDQMTGVYIVSAEGKLVGGNGPPGLAFNVSDVEAITGDKILTLSSGELPTGPGEINLDIATAAKAGYTVGDDVKLITPGAEPTMTAELTGLVKFGSEGGLVGATVTIFEEDAIQELFFEGQDVYTSISLTAAEGVSQEQLRDAAKTVLPEGLTAQTGDQVAKDGEEAIGEILGFISTFLLVFAAVSMVVGTFLIINTFSILVAQRSRELALLRAMGASRRQVNRAVLLEAFVIGLIGSTVGLAAGFFLAIGLKALFAAFGLNLGSAPMPIEPRTVVVSYVVGILVTMIAAYLPARRASRIAPVQAMRDDVALPETSLRRRFLVGTVMVLGGIGLMVAGFAGSGGQGLSLIGLGMLAILVGVALMAPILGRPIIHALGAVYRRLFGTVGTLATQNSLRNPRRTAATASALMVGLTLVALMAILGQSASASTDKAINESLTADLVVSNVVGDSFSTTFADEIREVDGVEAVAQFRYAFPRIEGSQAWVGAADPRDLSTALDIPMAAGQLNDLKDGSALVSSTEAKGKGLSIGDTFEMKFDAGSQKFTVAGIFPAGGTLPANYLTTLGSFNKAKVEERDALLYISKEPSASEAEVRREIDAVLEDVVTVTLKNQQEYADEQKGQINTFLNIIYALLGLAVIIAVLGIINTLALSVIERTREVGLLRAVGMSRKQLRRMVRLESVAIAVLGAVLGVVMGIAFGIALQRAIADDGVDVLAIPWLRLGIFVLVAAFVGVLAAVLPARRAAKLNVLDAITTE